MYHEYHLNILAYRTPKGVLTPTSPFNRKASSNGQENKTIHLLDSVVSFDWTRDVLTNDKEHQHKTSNSDEDRCNS